MRYVILVISCLLYFICYSFRSFLRSIFKQNRIHIKIIKEVLKLYVSNLCDIFHRSYLNLISVINAYENVFILSFPRNIFLEHTLVRKWYTLGESVGEKSQFNIS